MHTIIIIKILLFLRLFEVSFERKFFSASEHLEHEKCFLAMIMQKMIFVNVAITPMDPSANKNGNQFNPFRCDAISDPWHFLETKVFFLKRSILKNVNFLKFLNSRISD